jgi:hypothetical protein
VSSGERVPSVASASLRATRDALHAVCEHVLAAALYAETGHIGLRVVPGGFATPPFGADAKVITLGAEHLTVADRAGTRSGSYPSVRAAAQLAGIEPGAPRSVYTPATPLHPDDALQVDVDSAAAIIDWYVRVSHALDAFAPDSSQTLWPEHFDLAIRRGDCNFGGLAGDGTIPEPYVYVGPPFVPDGDAYFTQPFGAARTWTQTPTPELISAFFAEGARHAAELGVAST